MITSLVRTLLRNAAYASVSLTVALVALERLSPGSVLPYVPIAWFVMVSAVLCLVAPPVDEQRRWGRVIPATLWLVLSVAALLLMLGGAGQLRMLVVTAAVILVCFAVWAFGFTTPDEDYEH